VAYLLLIFGVFCCATSVIFIRTTETDPVALSAYRLLLAALLLAPLFVRALRRAREAGCAGGVGGAASGTVAVACLLRSALVPGLLLALHFISWLIGARLTPSANASLIVNMVPVVMPFILYALMRETLNRMEVAGTVLAMVGVVVLGAGDFNFQPQYLTGDIICFLSMLLYGVYLAYGRLNRAIPSIYLYVVPVYLIAGVIALAVALVLEMLGRAGPWIGADLRVEWIGIIGLAVVPTIFGHSLMNWAMQQLRGQVVAIVNLSQFIFAGAMGYMILNEVPHLSFYAACVLVVGGSVVAIRAASRPLRRAVAEGEGAV